MAGGQEPARPALGDVIGSVPDGSGRGTIVLRGEVDAAALDRLGQHIDTFLARCPDRPAGTPALRIDAAAVDSYDTGLLDLLACTQRRLEARHGRLRVTGLHPSLLAPDSEN